MASRKKKIANKDRGITAALVARRESAAVTTVSESVDDLLTRMGKMRERLKKEREELLAEAERQREETLAQIANIDRQLEKLGEPPATPLVDATAHGESDWRTTLVKAVEADPSDDPAPKGSARPVRPGTRLDTLIRRFRRHTGFTGNEVAEALDLNPPAAFGLIYQGRKRGLVKKLGVVDGTVRWRIVG